MCIENDEMKITIDIDDKLLEQAKALFPSKTVSEIVNIALTSFIENHKTDIII